MWVVNRKQTHLPKAAGPYVPGCMDVMLGYIKEGIFMRLYYPTNYEKDDLNLAERWCPWIPDSDYVTGLANVLMLFKFIIKLFYYWSGHMRIPVVYGGKPKTDQKLKCVVLSHGLGGNRVLNSSVCCELASRGFLVVALEHRDHSACNTFYYSTKEDAQNERRTLIDYEPIKLGKEHFKRRKDQVEYRANECSKVLDFLFDLNKGVVAYNVMDDVPTQHQIDFRLEDLVGQLDVGSMVMAGHSFGGGTALLTLGKRQEFKLGILMDPWMFPIKEENLDKHVKKPLLFVNTQTFHIATNVSAMSSHLANDHTKMYTILHTTHESQTDSVFLIGYWLNWFMKKLDPVVGLRINNSIILDFLDQHVGCPTSIEDCRKYLEEQKENIEVGLTKPWA